MSMTCAYRRCHVCDAICEAKSHVRRCTKCGKAFAPFFYFDDKFTPVQSEGALRPPPLDGQWRPLQGLTAYWAGD